MSARQLPLSRLGHLIPPLVEGQALVALVPTTADLVWAAKCAWDIARIAARGGRRVALVDLSIEEPCLHQVVGLSPNDGIVDAFEYGVSLAKTAHEVDGVFFIAAGSYTASAGDLYAHPRWRKLQAGFRAEGALLLLFLSPHGLGRLSAVADGAIALAPEGLDPASTPGVEIAVAQGRGTPLLGVARDRWMPSSPAVPLPAPLPEPATSVSVSGSRRRGVVRAATATVVLAGTLAVGWSGWTLFAGRPDSVEQPAPARPAPPAAAPAVTGDTLAWTIQLAAYGSLENALAHVDRLWVEANVPAMVTPVPQTGGTAIWYRVLAGSYPTREAASAARDTLWRRGVARRGIGDLLRAPYSFVTEPGASLEALRVRGVPAVPGPQADRILVGAFESREQAAFTEAALKRAGVRATLLPRVGTRP